MVWIPPGFAHGYSTLNNEADVLYKMTELHSPEHERTLLWNDPDLAIPWDAPKKPILSFKDSNGTLLKESEIFD
jgi:dTDP-4-dehydrorhamnose 3,5-epimerase